MPAQHTESLQIEREEGPSKGRYVVRMDGVEAEMTYSRASESAIIIDHTSVPDALRGRSVGQALVRRAVEDARAEGRTITPLCPFARAQIARHAEWQDVLRHSPGKQRLRKQRSSPFEKMFPRKRRRPPRSQPPRTEWRRPGGRRQ